jgi:hypothetical protein
VKSARHVYLWQEVEIMIRKITELAMSRPDVWLLDIIDVASPCPAAWEKMQGTDKVRHCAQCQKNVYHLSGMTRPEAENVIREQEGNLCIRFYRRADGKIMTTDCPVGLRTLRRQAARLVAGIAAMLAVLSCGSIFARSRGYDEVRDSAQAYSGPMQSLINWLDPPVQNIGGIGSFLPKASGPDRMDRNET